MSGNNPAKYDERNLGRQQGFVYASIDGMADHLCKLEAEVRKETAQLKRIQSEIDLNVAEVQRINWNAYALVENEGKTCEYQVKAQELARNASQLFKDYDHFKRACASYDFVKEIGGIHKIYEYKNKGEDTYESNNGTSSKRGKTSMSASSLQNLADAACQARDFEESDDELEFLFERKRTGSKRCRKSQEASIHIE